MIRDPYRRPNIKTDLVTRERANCRSADSPREGQQGLMVEYTGKDYDRFSFQQGTEKHQCNPVVREKQ